MEPRSGERSFIITPWLLITHVEVDAVLGVKHLWCWPQWHTGPIHPLWDTLVVVGASSGSPIWVLLAHGAEHIWGRDTSGDSSGIRGLLGAGEDGVGHPTPV